MSLSGIKGIARGAEMDCVYIVALNIAWEYLAVLSV